MSFRRRQIALCQLHLGQVEPAIALLWGKGQGELGPENVIGLMLVLLAVVAKLSVAMGRTADVASNVGWLRAVPLVIGSVAAYWTIDRVLLLV